MYIILSNNEVKRLLRVFRFFLHNTQSLVLGNTFLFDNFGNGNPLMNKKTNILPDPLSLSGRKVVIYSLPTSQRHGCSSE